MTAPLIWGAARAHAQHAAIGPDLRDFPPRETAPPSDPQLRLLQFDELHPGRTTHNLHFTYRLRGALDPVALERALQGAWARHQGLRASFPTSAQQCFHDPSAWNLQRPQAPIADTEAWAYAQARTLAATPYALSRDALLRAGLYAIGPDDHLLTVAVHHIVFDAWSLDLLHRELAAGYRAATQGEPDRRPPLRTSYAQYAAWERARADDPAVQGPLLEHWSGYLAGHPQMARLDPAERTRSTVAPAAGPRRRRTLALDAAVVAPLRELAAAQGTSLFTVLMAGCAALVAQRTGDRDFVVLSPSAGRTVPAVHDLIGYFVNLHVLRADLREAPDFATLVAGCARGTSGALEHQELPSRLAAPLYGLSPGTPPLLFGLQNTPGRPLVLGDVAVTVEHLDCGDADFGLYLEIEPGAGDGLTVVATYDGARHAGEWVGDLLDDYRAVLARYGADAARELVVAEPRPPASAPRPDPRAAGADADADASPTTAGPLEFLREQIAQLIGVDTIDADLAPLALGLDSLKLIELATRVRTELGVDAPLRAYARAPSVRALADDLLLLLIAAPSSPPASSTAPTASGPAEVFVL